MVPNKTLSLPFVEPNLRVEERRDGSILLSQDHPLVDVVPTIAHLFVDRAHQIPDRVFMAETAADGAWKRISYQQLLTRALRIAAAFASHGHVPGERILVLTGPSIDHAAVMLGAMLAGLITVPLSPAYALVADRSRLEHAIQLVRPNLVFAEHAEICSDAFKNSRDAGISTLCSNDSSLEAFEENSPPSDPDELLAKIGADTVFKLLLTSGSTAMPKAVIQTHGMSCASLAFEASLSTLPVGVREPQVVLDWMPWSHVSGGVTIFNNIIFSGASLYLDQGKPIPGKFSPTIRNLRSFPQEVFSTLPIGLAMLASAMDTDKSLRASFFSRLLYVKSGGAALPEEVRRHFQSHALRETGREVPILMGYGTTETHGICSVTHETVRAFSLGLPKPGVLAKLSPVGGGYELRIKAASVTPGYFGDEAATAAAFDDEGFFQTGDGVQIDSEGNRPELVFTGRSGEIFKTATGTWVNSSELRAAILDVLEGEATDCLIVGEGQLMISAFIWCEIEPQPRIRIVDLINQFNSTATGASRRIGRIIFSAIPISVERFERTEKGSLNRQIIIANRAEELAALYENIPAEKTSSNVVDLTRVACKHSKPTIFEKGMT